MSNYKKHLLLKHLYASWKDGEDKTTTSYQTTSFGILKIEELCITLSNDGYIRKITEDTDNKAHRYLIEDLGKSAFIDKHFLHKVLFFSFDFWKWFLPFLLALFGALNSVFGWVEK